MRYYSDSGRSLVVVVCWLIRRKARLRIPGYASKRYIKKTLREIERKNKPAMKKFLKNLSFGVDIKLEVLPLNI